MKSTKYLKEFDKKNGIFAKNGHFWSQKGISFTLGVFLYLSKLSPYEKKAMNSLHEIGGDNRNQCINEFCGGIAYKLN